MKKQILIVIGFLLLITLTACGGGSSSSNTSSNSGSDTGGNHSASSELTIKVGLVVGDWSPHHEGLSAWKDLVEERTSGSITLELYPDGQLGGEREMLEGIQQGSLESGVISSVVYSVFDQRASVIDIPYLVSTFDEAEEMMDGPVGEQIAKNFEEKGLKVLAWGHNDFRVISNNVRSVQNPEDMQGIKMRVPENRVLTNWFEKLGTLTTTMPTTDIYNALQQGVVDGQDNGPVLTYAGKYFEHQKYLTISNHQYSPVGFFVNLDFWNTLSEEQQTVLEETAKEAAIVERAAIRKFNDISIEDMENAGLEVYHLSAEELQAFKETTADAIDEIKSTAGAELVDMALKEVGY